MIVRPMNIDQPFANGTEGLQGRGGAIDELFVGAGIGEGALQNELAIFARLQAILIEEGVQRCLKVADVEDRLHGTGVGPTADQRPVGALAENKIERPDEDGLAGPGFAGDDVQARLQFEREVGDEREVLDAQRGQHGGNSSRRMWRVC